MKRLTILLLALSSGLMAQDLVISERPFAEFEIHSLLQDINPTIKSSAKIQLEAEFALKEWVDYLTSDEFGETSGLFINKNTNYGIVSNLWLTSANNRRTVVGMLFEDTSTLVIKNFQFNSLEEEIKYSDDAGVAFYTIRPKGEPEHAIDIYLILLKQ